MLGSSRLTSSFRVVVVLSALTVAAGPAVAVKRRAFVTSVSGTGNLASWPGAGGLTGLAAADNICRVRAISGGLPNGDTYRAWLSTSTTDAYCHVQGLSGTRADGCGGQSQPAGPWYLSNGITPFTGSLAELAGPERAIYRPVTLDEFGDAVPTLSDSMVWTGTRPNGTRELETCSDWTSASAAQSGKFGYALTAASSWTAWNPDSCNASKRLLCFEPGASEAAYSPYWFPGALVFLTSASGSGELGTWPQSGGATGLAAGDAICRNLATAAHLPDPGSFVAWLSSDTVDAADRILPAGVPFRRVDGAIVANDRDDLLDGSIDTSIHVEETGAFAAGSTVWTGTLADGTASPTQCEAWSSQAQPDSATFGIAAAARVPGWTAISPVTCTFDFLRLVCVSNAVTLFWDGFDQTGDASRWSSVAP